MVSPPALLQAGLPLKALGMVEGPEVPTMVLVTPMFPLTPEACYTCKASGCVLISFDFDAIMAQVWYCRTDFQSQLKQAGEPRRGRFP
jgi:hypothetical protein